MLKQIGIVSFTPNKSNIKNIIENIVKWGCTNNVKIICHYKLQHLHIDNVIFDDDKVLRSCNLIIAIGGDGTILATSRITAGQKTPILGVNTGTIGFLTDFHPHEIIDALEEFKNEKAIINTKIMLECFMQENNAISNSNNNWHPALNEVLLKSSHPEDLIKIIVKLNSNFLTEYWADSLLFSTPTGSTAYNLSSGGPIIYPGTDAIVINPVNPTSLSVRPLVINSDTKISAQVYSPHPISVILDGKPRGVLNNSETLCIQKSSLATYFITSNRFGFVDALKDKLGWNGTPKAIT